MDHGAGLVLVLTGGGRPAQMMGGGMMGGGAMGMMGPGQGPAMGGCPGMGAQASAFDPEWPWITFALTHAKDLGLSDEQVTQLGGLREEFLKDAGRLVQDIRAGESALAQLYAQKPLDLSAVEAKIREIAGRRPSCASRGQDAAKGTALTDEQRQKIFDPSWRMGRMMGATEPSRPARSF
jgi:hypothetical protein